MENKQAYDQWSASYDNVINKTRDLEAIALRSMLGDLPFSKVIELGCGTGKNTQWFAEHGKDVQAADFSEGMVAEAKARVKAAHVHFTIADITKVWDFVTRKADLITCSLVLEHIADLDFIFGQARLHLVEGGKFYIGELHPFKQYQGSKARFETSGETKILECYTHHISDYMEAARVHGFRCFQFLEWFDEDDKTAAPRIASFVFELVAI